MGRKLHELSIDELAVATVGTERLAGMDSAEAKIFRAEAARRESTSKGVVAYVARARRFAALIDEGFTMSAFHRDGFSRADRQLALALGAKRSWPRIAASDRKVKLSTRRP